MHLLMLWHSMASAELISAKPLLALVGVVIGVAGPFDHPGSWEQPGMHLLMFWHNMLTPMAPMGTGRDAYCARTSVTHSATHLLKVSPIFECENSRVHSHGEYRYTSKQRRAQRGAAASPGSRSLPTLPSHTR